MIAIAARPLAAGAQTLPPNTILDRYAVTDAGLEKPAT